MDTLFSMDSDEVKEVKQIIWDSRGPHRWAIHPTDHELLVLITGTMAQIYSWNTLLKVTTGHGIFLEGSILAELSVRSIVPCFNGSTLSTVFSNSRGPQSVSKILLWDASDFNSTSERAAPVPHYQALSNEVEFLIGSYDQKVVFLDRSGWVCSADKASFNIASYARHFFIPTDWLKINGDLLIKVSSQGDILFVKRDEVAVIKKGLEINERVSKSQPSRPSAAIFGARKPSSGSGKPLFKIRSM